MKSIVAVVAAGLALAACGGEIVPEADAPTAEAAALAERTRYESRQADAAALAPIAEEFVKLSLAIGVHDEAFVDAYHGPAEWRVSAIAEKRSLEVLENDAQGLLISVARSNADAPSIRGAMLEKLIRAALARVQMVRGETFTFDDETRLLYDAVAPAYDVAEFEAALGELEALLPGAGALSDRVDAFMTSLAIPADKRQAVFDAAIAECRKRTLAHYDLPANERFTLSFVTDKPWSGYNWYQGDYNSLIEVNTELPIFIDRAVDLGCHEGYPGHHTWNVLLERELLEKQGWIEYSVYPLFSPLSVTAEGSANYGIELAFPGDEKIAFERDVLFPLAGLDPAKAEMLEALTKAKRRLSHAGNHIAREYLEGRMDRETAVELLAKYGVYSRERAMQRMRFIDSYRGYVINYNIGRDIVSGYIDRKAAGGVDRWAAFELLLTTPLAASDIEGAQ